MNLPFLLILLCIAAGVVLLFVRTDLLRGVLTTAAVLVMAGGVLLLASSELTVYTDSPVDKVMLLLELAMAVYIGYVAVRHRRWLILAMAVLQTAVMLWFEHSAQLQPAAALRIDKLSVVLALINGLVGGGICLYALGYMKRYHEETHREVKDRRPLFFCTLFVFTGAMFGIVFANNLLWLYFFWEVTTLCSFLLIGYTQTKEAQNNALRALAMNLLGGVAFALGIVWFHRQTGSIALSDLVLSRHGAALIPAALLCLAGITKSAQLPFSSWLLGAMVAPTPVSALLHSSTMVKAGVYLILRLAPVVTGTTVGLMVALVGGTTFLIGSLAAITCHDAKRVLAYSTVANLGLIVLCGGIGTYAAVWAGVLLIIFHAVAKCLLFLCVGVVEHEIHSRDIESMSGLILNMPQVAIMMLIGMAGMFLAPFGMLISKWAVLKAVVDAYPELTIFIVFGSSATLFFWVKWMGKLVEVVAPRERLPKPLSLGELTALYGLSAGTFLACLLFPLISWAFIEPYLQAVFGQTASIGQGNIVIMMIMMAMVVLFPLSFIHYGRGVKVVDAYLGGANTGIGFLGSANQEQKLSMQNYYFGSFFQEGVLTRWGVAGASALICVMLTSAGVHGRTAEQPRGPETAAVSNSFPLTNQVTASSASGGAFADRTLSTATFTRHKPN